MCKHFSKAERVYLLIGVNKTEPGVAKWDEKVGRSESKSENFSGDSQERLYVGQDSGNWDKEGNFKKVW
jgi:hypothetical protein